MNLVFYDIRTTGNQPGFDQILEIAAIHTDANFNGLDRLQAGCCLMPHIAPSPIALLASGAEASQFFDRTLGSHFELIGQIETTFRKWSPATFIQFNSKTSGDPMLRQALFQTLRDPDLMRSNGNRSLDAVDLAEAAACVAPRALAAMRGFEFHDVAAANGVAFTRNHNVLARVFTTIHLTRLIASKAPELWAVALAHADKPLLAAPMASAPDMTPASENAVKAAPAAALPCERDLRTQGLRSFQGRLVNADVRALHPSPSEPSPDEQRNDEVISGRDRELCAAFHAAPWEEKPPILTKMNDPRLREFGRRLLAFERRDLLSRAELTHHFHWLRRRLMGDFRVPWRTLPDAIAEITAARASGRLDNEAQRRLDEYLAICEARLAWRQLWR